MRSLPWIAAPLLLLPAISAWAGAKTAFKTGSVRFTQEGKEASWKLATGELEANNGAGDVSLEFTPDGKPAQGAGSLMELTFSKQGDGSILFTSLTVINSPNPVYNAFTGGGCEVSASQVDAKGVKGTGSCKDPGRQGVVSKLAFEAKP